MISRPQLLASLWRSERGLSALLVFLVLTLFVGAPLVATATIGPLVFEALFSLLLISGIFAVSRRRIVTIGVSILAFLALGLRWAMFWRPGPRLEIWEAALSVVSLSILTALVLIQVFQGGPITGYRIQGAIAAYLLIGIVWTAVYELLIRVLPGVVFRFTNGMEGPARFTHGLAYFSFVTLTTVGYGDITPVHPLARSLAMAEALIGQLYPAILIGRLVSMELESRRHK
jgi:hypothetical protein